jgi:5-oxoprolinase (ATP-hydrolysing)
MYSQSFLVISPRERGVEPITLAILSGSRRVAPFGLAGGGEGRCGRNALLRSEGGCEERGGSAPVAMKPGDVFVLETPGGGGGGVRGDRA